MSAEKQRREQLRQEHTKQVSRDKSSNAADLERVDRPDMRAGLSQVSGVVLQQRRLQVSILQQRFVGAPRPATMSEPADRAEPDAPAR